MRTGQLLSIALVLLCVTASFSVSAQVATGPGSSAANQPGVQITVPQGNLTAGDSFEVKLTLDMPAPCAVNVNVWFSNSTRDGFMALGNIAKGDTAVLLRVDLPRDLPAGDYKSSSGTLLPCPGYTRQRSFTVPVRTVTVNALPDPNQYPTTADLELSLTQKQFLETKVAQLSDLNSQLNTRLEQNSADLPELRTFLIETVKQAEEALNVTEIQYRKQIMKSQGNPPAFFADFHAQYEALLVSLRAPIPGVANVVAQPKAALLFVQLKKRGPIEQLVNTWPPAALAVWGTIKDNLKAYKYVKDTNRITFSAQLMSYPTGARVSYKKVIDEDYRDYSSPTNVTNASFELATWIFKFHKDGCTDVPALRVDPYEDSQPVVSVEFMHCRGK
jgi:hypothetical protein